MRGVMLSARRGVGVAALAASLLLGACTIIPPGRMPEHGPVAPRPPAAPTAPSPTLPPPVPPPAVPPPNAVVVGVAPGPDIAGLALGGARPGAALRSFAESCRALLLRTDQSGLTRIDDWRPACAAAATWPSTDAARFFTTWFETARVSDGRSYVTGYFEPEIAGTRTRQPGFAVPVYAMPRDLVRAWPFETPFEQRVGQPPLGRFDKDGRFVPYYDRAQIEDGALAGQGLEIGWAADPAELFFLQIQGSGRLIGPDGTVVRLGFAGQNGYPYTGIGQVMQSRGLIGTGPGQYAGSMQGIMAYLHDHPAEGKALMRLNQSYIFFREVTGEGPVGALNVPIHSQVTLAVDPLMVPLGAPVLIAGADHPEVNGLWVAQDTGGAIKGPNRFDSFWGAGPTARVIAGGMAAHGDALVLLPKGTLARLGPTPASPPTPRR